MKTEMIELLRCPQIGQRFSFESCNDSALELGGGWLISVDCKHRYPVIKGIPKFILISNYADTFDMQWDHFRTMQLESYAGQPILTDRFWQATGWQPEKLKDQCDLVFLRSLSRP